MKYTKTIKYGNFLEVYNYELSPQPKVKIGKDKDKIERDEEDLFAKRLDNIKVTKRNFTRLISANLIKNKPLLVSLTYSENMTDIAIGYQDFRKFAQALRNKFGNHFKYIAAPEFQKRGAVHFHVLFWDLPDTVSPAQERKERIIQSFWGHGYVDLELTDGSDKLAGYLAKYMAKAFVDTRLKNKKAYVASRNISRPVVDKYTLTLASLYLYLDPNDVPIYEKEYDTAWLGKCRYRLFKRNNPL